MCPPGPSTSDIGVYWTDEDLIVSLAKIQNGSPLPSNVIADVNPFEHKPSLLPCDVWFFVCTDNQKETSIGSWRTKGDGCQIYSDSKRTGWRTTLEFFEDQSNGEYKTDWVMQKYWITQDGSNSLMASSSLCRVFPCDGECRKQKRQRHGSPLVEGHNICDHNGPTRNSQVMECHDEKESSDCTANQDDIDCFSRGDYLELLDLETPRSSSSSSDNSSCVSMASDEVFDYLTLLNDLEPESHKEVQSKSTSCNLNVTTSSNPNAVVFCPATNDIVVACEESQSAGKSPEQEHSSQGPPLEGKLENIKDGTKHDENIKDGTKHDAPNSDEASTSQSSMPDKGKKVTSGKKMKMLGKKYLCFMPF